MLVRVAVQGLGLGLAISRQFMETMGGRLDLVPSQLLSGARFELTLPLVRSADPTAHKDPSASKRVSKVKQ